MKQFQLVLLLCSLIAITFSQNSEATFLSNTNQTGVTSNLTSLNQYYNGLFTFYGLKQNELLQCYTEQTAGILFDYYKLSYQFGKAFINADKKSVRKIFPTFQVYNDTLASSFECIYNTDDYQALLKKLKINVKSYNEMFYAQNLYLQAHLRDWNLFYTPVYALLQANEYFKAGLAIAPIVKFAVINATQEHQEWEFLTSFINGVFYYWNQTLPTDVIYCSKDVSAEPQVYLLTNWTQVVANATFQTAANKTQEFFQSKGGALYNEIPMEVKACQQESFDAIKLSQIVGFDVFSEEFRAGVVKYYLQNGIIYWNLFTEMQNMIQNNNFFGAGTMFGGFLYDVQQMLFESKLQEEEKMKLQEQLN